MRKNDEQQRNKKTRIVSLMLVLTLITTCLLSSTLAKYTSEVGGKDTARVATWGFDSSNLGDPATTTLGLFNTQYSNSTPTVTVNSVDGDKVVAPGTSGAVTLAFTGSSEVDTLLTYELDATYKNPVDVGGTPYDIPLVYAVNLDGEGAKYYSDYYAIGKVYLKLVNPSTGVTSNTEVDIIGNFDALETAFNTDTVNTKTVVKANTLYSTANQTIIWCWAYEEYTDNTFAEAKLDTNQDKIDTALGEAAYAESNGTATAVPTTVDADAVPNVELTITVTATQID